MNPNYLNLTLTAVSYLGTWLVLSTVAGLGILLLLWLAQPLTKTWNAATRYWVGWSGVMLTIALPIFCLAWTAPTPVRETQAPTSARQTQPALVTSTPLATVPSSIALPEAPSFDKTLSGPSIESRAVPPSPAPVSFSIVKPTSSFTGFSWKPSPATLFWIGALWLTGCIFLCARLILAALVLRRWKSSATSVTAQEQEQWNQLSAELKIRRKASLARSPTVRIPMALGFFRPMVLLPAQLALQTEDQRAILIHELAHLQRRDDWMNLIQQSLLALAFANPALWLLFRHINLQSEIACDDWVIHHAVEQKNYAHCLARLAEQFPKASPLCLATGAWGSPHQLIRRVESLLSPKRARGISVSRAAFLVILGLSAGTLWSAQYANSISMKLVQAVLPATLREDSKNLEAVQKPAQSQDNDLEKFRKADQEFQLTQTTAPAAAPTPAATPAVPKTKPVTATPGVAPATAPKKAASARELMLEEIELVEDQLERSKKLRLNNSVSEGELQQLERELVKLKKELAVYDESQGRFPGLQPPTAPEPPDHSERLNLLLGIAETDGDESVRIAALEGIQKINSIGSLERLSKLFLKEKSDNLRLHILGTIGTLSYEEKIDYLIKLYPELREEKARLIFFDFLPVYKQVQPNIYQWNHVTPESAVPFLSQIIQSKSESKDVKQKATEAFYRTPGNIALENVVKIIENSEDQAIKLNIMGYLSSKGGEKGLKILEQLAKTDTDPEVRKKAVSLISNAQENHVRFGTSNPPRIIPSRPMRVNQPGSLPPVAPATTPPSLPPPTDPQPVAPAPDAPPPAPPKDAAPVAPQAATTVEAPFFTVSGEVRRPSRFPIKPTDEVTVAKAIAMAGGLTDFALKKKIKLYRAGSEKPIEVDYTKDLKSSNPLKIKTGDLVYIERSKL